MKRGEFIVFEGNDGCGKTTQIQRFISNFKKNYPYESIHATREASDGPIGKVLREVYLEGKRDIDESIINMIYVADRYDHIMNREDGILVTLDQGINVVCDRFYYSSFAYDTYRHVNDRNVWQKEFWEIVNRNKSNISAIVPDIVFYIRTHPNTVIDHLSHRSDAPTVYEHAGKLKKIHRSYERVMEMMKWAHHPIITINGDQSVDRVAEDIWDAYQNMQ